MVPPFRYFESDTVLCELRQVMRPAAAVLSGCEGYAGTGPQAAVVQPNKGASLTGLKLDLD
jgi:hypothetical protein